MAVTVKAENLIYLSPQHGHKGWIWAKQEAKQKPAISLKPGSAGVTASV